MIAYCYIAAVGTTIFTLSSLILSVLIWAALFTLNCLIIATLRNRTFFNSDKKEKSPRSGQTCGEDNASFKTEEEKDDRCREIEMNSVDSVTSGGKRKRAQDSQMPARNGLYSMKFLFVCITLFQLKQIIH